LIVADSSYLVERLIERRGDWGTEDLVSPDLAVPEVVNAVLIQERILHTLSDGRPYIESLFGAVDSAALQLVKVTESLVEEAYEIAMRNGQAIYDCIFVALALKYGVPLKTNDRRQAKVFADELSTREGSLSQ